jgi:hypothetical protein
MDGAKMDGGRACEEENFTIMEPQALSLNDVICHEEVFSDIRLSTRQIGFEISMLLSKSTLNSFCQERDLPEDSTGML